MQGVINKGNMRSCFLSTENFIRVEQKKQGFESIFKELIVTHKEVPISQNAYFHFGVRQSFAITRKSSEEQRQEEPQRTQRERREDRKDRIGERKDRMNRIDRMIGIGKRKERK